MIQRVEMGWRVLAKAIAFAVFGMGSLLLVAVVSPACRLWPGTREQKVDRIQRMVHHSFRLFIWFMESLRLMEKMRFTGMERLRSGGPCLIIANHPTLIDVVALISRLPRVDCIVKRALSKNFLTRGIVSNAGYIPNDGGEEIVAEAVHRIEQGHSLLLFPEGTRSPRGGLGAFNRGFAHIVARTGCPLLPITILCDPPQLMKGEKFCHVPPRRPQWVISVDEPFAVDRYYETTDTNAIAARKLSCAVRQYYEKRLMHAESEHAAPRERAQATVG